jgi:hypothetical protein
MEAGALIAARYKALEGVLDERLRRKQGLWGMVSQACEPGDWCRAGIDSPLASKEIELPNPTNSETLRRIRWPGAGRKKVADRDPGVCQAPEQLV